MIILIDLGYIRNGYDTKNPKNGKKWQKGMAPQKIYPPGVPNQEFAPLEVKNAKMGTVGKSRSLSGQVLSHQKFGRIKNYGFGQKNWAGAKILGLAENFGFGGM